MIQFILLLTHKITKIFYIKFAADTSELERNKENSTDESMYPFIKKLIYRKPKIDKIDKLDTDLISNTKKKLKQENVT